MFISFPRAISGQIKSDIGILGGASYYLGDVNHSRHFYSPSPAGGFIYRYNFNPRNSIRFNALYVMLRGDPADFDEPYPGFPAGQAKLSNVVDVGLSTEYNFMTYKATKLRKNRYTPYVSGGIGYIAMLDGGNTFALNFAGGVKYNLTRRMSAGAEWTFRKTFSDQLDRVQNIGHENNIFFHNKDWYSIVGVFVTYKIFDLGVDCPAYEF